MAIDKRLKIYDSQGNEVDYDILAADVKFANDGKDLPTKLAELEEEIGEGGYTPPAGGIPATDLAPAVQTSLGKADTAYQKPASGIPATDLADGVIPDVSGFATTENITDAINDLVDGAPAALDTLKELADALADEDDAVAALTSALAGKVDKNGTDSLMTAAEHTKLAGLPTSTELGNTYATKTELADKVDKVTGKGLSTNDYTDAEKTKLAGIAAGATANQGTVTGIKVNDGQVQEPTNGVVSLQIEEGGSVESVTVNGTKLTPDGNGDVNIGTVITDVSTLATKTELNGKQDTISDLATIRSGASAGATAVQPAALETAMAGKQDTLTFDNSPTANSNNPVKSGGVKAYVDTAVAGAEIAVIPQGSVGIIDNLVTDDNTQVLSAAQGVVLNDIKADKSSFSHEEGQTYDKTLCTTNNRYINAGNGKSVSLNGYKHTDFIAIPSYATKFDYLSTTNDNITGIAFYSGTTEADYISGVLNKNALTTYTAAIPQGATHVRYCYQNSGTDPASTLRLYIDGIEGYTMMINDVVEKSAEMLTESSVSRVETMVYDDDVCMYGGYINKNNGSYNANSTYVNGFASSDYLPVTPGETLIVNSNWTFQNVGLAFYKSDKSTYVSGYLLDNDVDTQLTVPVNAEYIRITTRPGSGGHTSVKRTRSGSEGLQWELDKIEGRLAAIEETGIADTNGRHILFVSNSFGTDSCENLAAILANMGISEWNSVQRLYYGGRTYKGWVDNADSATSVSMVDVFGNGLHSNVAKSLSAQLTLPWDVIVFNTVYSAAPSAGDTEPYLSQLIDMALRLCPNKAVKFYYMQTWQNWKASYSGIIETEKPLIKDHEIGIIPCGTAIENIRQVYSDASYYHLAQEDSQYLHLASGVAEYTAALTVAQALFGDLAAREGKTLYDDDTSIEATSASGNLGAVSVDSSNRAKCQRAAMFAVIHPWGTTDVSIING